MDSEISQSSTEKDTTKGLLHTHYIKAPNYSESHCNGVFGGVTPNGEIHIAFFSERVPFPKVVIDELEMDKSTNHAKLTGEPKSLGKEGRIRHINSSVYLDLDTAESILKWLQKKVEEGRKTKI